MIYPTIKPCADGSNTLIHPIVGDAYHSLQGAVGESRHIYIEAGLEAIDKKEIRLFEVGFGSGLNALLTLERATERGIRVEYHTIELYPVDPTVIQELNYQHYCSQEHYNTFLSLHQLPWNAPLSELSPFFSFRKINEDLEKSPLPADLDLIYFDAFSPDSQPQLWSVSIFERLYESLNPGGRLVTYSAKGVVKQALRTVGFEVKRLPGALGKHHMLCAIKQ